MSNPFDRIPFSRDFSSFSINFYRIYVQLWFLNFNCHSGGKRVLLSDIHCTSFHVREINCRLSQRALLFKAMLLKHWLPCEDVIFLG